MARERSLVVWAVAAGVALAAGFPGRAAGAQAPLDEAVRFEVRTVGDSTFEFDAGDRRWIKPGQHGIAVDPRRRDALIARFEVLRVDSSVVTALVTGQTARVSTDHVALLHRPLSRWYVARHFWAGAVAGALVGLASGAAIW